MEDDDAGGEPLDVIGDSSMSSSRGSENTALNTTMDTTATTELTVLEDVVSNNTSSYDDSYYCDVQQQQHRQRFSPNDTEESSSSNDISASTTAQLHSTFPCSSSTLGLCPYGSSRAAIIATPHEAQDVELDSTGGTLFTTHAHTTSTSSHVTNWCSVGIHRRSNSSSNTSQSVLRPDSDRNSCVGSEDLVTATEYLEKHKAFVVGDNRCRIIDSFDE